MHIPDGINSNLKNIPHVGSGKVSFKIHQDLFPKFRGQFQLLSVYLYLSVSSLFQ